MKEIICGVLAGIYMMPACVASVNKTDAEFVDKTGNVWGWYLESGESYRKNENVVLVMHDNGTPEIYDDIIIMVQKGR